MYKRAEGYFQGKAVSDSRTASKTEVYYQSWTPENTIGTLVVTHGLGEHSESYHRLAEGLAGSGWKIVVWDLRGHGQSEGKRGVIEKFSYFGDDLMTLLEIVRAQNQNHQPIVMLGHSMGGLITTSFILNRAPQSVRGVVLSSPLFGVAVKVPKLKEQLGRKLAGYLPNFTLYSGLKFEDLTRDKAVVAEYERDTLRHERISTSMFVQMTDLMQVCLQSASKFAYPLFVQQAGEDKIVSASATRDFFNRVENKDKEMIVYDDYYHEVYNEVGREKVFADLRRWLARFERT
jgi:alpha-beta hydrolase superfamily lysophospholipase